MGIGCHGRESAQVTRERLAHFPCNEADPGIHANQRNRMVRHCHISDEAVHVWGVFSKRIVPFCNVLRLELSISYPWGINPSSQSQRYLWDLQSVSHLQPD